MHPPPAWRGGGVKNFRKVFAEGERLGGGGGRGRSSNFEVKIKTP